MTSFSAICSAGERVCTICGRSHFSNGGNPAPPIMRGISLSAASCARRDDSVQPFIKLRVASSPHS
jgi:hypothetical protein